MTNDDSQITNSDIDLKKWIRENLIISVEYSGENSVNIKLSLSGDAIEFTSAYLYIP